MEARGWRFEAKAKPIEGTVEAAQYTMYGRTKGAGHENMSRALRFKPIDLTLLNNREYYAFTSFLLLLFP
jgi:hypothetical protein